MSVQHRLLDCMPVLMEQRQIYVESQTATTIYWKLRSLNQLINTQMQLQGHPVHTSLQERSSHGKLHKTSDIIFYGYLPSRT